MGRSLTATPLRIGPLEVWPPVVLAPMAGVTNAPFRRLCRSYGPDDAILYVSEMVLARAVLEDQGRTAQMLAFGPDESPRSVQLYGVDPTVVGQAVARLVDAGRVDHLDLNFGCPAAKVTRKGGGAALPVRTRLLADIIAAAVRAAGAVPVTVKFRTGIDARRLTHLSTARIAEDQGAAAVALHARTAEQHYAGRADWSAIAAVKDAVRTIPVLGNGDIMTGADALAMMAATGCDGVVVGRGCLGRPWLFADLADAFAGRPPAPSPRLGDVTGVMAAHAALLADWFGEPLGVRDFRKHTSWYLRGYPCGGAVRRRLNQVGTLAELDDLLGGLDPELTLPPGSEHLVRGHTSGPRKVVLPDGWLAGADDPTVPQGAELAVSGG
ncbi:tRNA dihydrouridine synthase DusB [soil metagenome]